MKKLLLDTNIVIDLLAQREPFYNDAAKIFSLADKKKIKISVSALTFANTNYILQKSNNIQSTREILRKLKVIVNVISLNDKVIDLALNDSGFGDFEDGLQYYSALENNLDIIVTRNQKDFKASKIPIMNAAEFIASLT